jgi:hypothetical protein
LQVGPGEHCGPNQQIFYAIAVQVSVTIGSEKIGVEPDCRDSANIAPNDERRRKHWSEKLDLRQAITAQVDPR